MSIVSPPPVSVPSTWHQRIVVIRHGEREDSKSGRDHPDPALTVEGRQAVANVAESIKLALCQPSPTSSSSAPPNPPNAAVGDGPSPVVLLPPVDFTRHTMARILRSPFRRTAETADALYDAGLGSNFNPPEDDNSLSEIFNERVIKSPVPPVAVFKENSRGKRPTWGETQRAAADRFADSFFQLADEFPHQDLVLVTHGDALASIMQSLIPGRVVYETEFLSYLVFERVALWVRGPKFVLLHSEGVKFFDEPTPEDVTNSEAVSELSSDPVFSSQKGGKTTSHAPNSAPQFHSSPSTTVIKMASPASVSRRDVVFGDSRASATAISMEPTTGGSNNNRTSSPYQQTVGYPKLGAGRPHGGNVGSNGGALAQQASLSLRTRIFLALAALCSQTLVFLAMSQSLQDAVLYFALVICIEIRRFIFRIPYVKTFAQLFLKEFCMRDNSVPYEQIPNDDEDEKRNINRNNLRCSSTHSPNSFVALHFIPFVEWVWSRLRWTLLLFGAFSILSTLLHVIVGQPASSAIRSLKQYFTSFWGIAAFVAHLVISAF